MKKNILKHITVEGFAHGTDLSNCEILENELNEAKGRLKLAKKDVKEAKHKLNQALEEVINEIENKKKEIKETQSNLSNNPAASSDFNSESIKSKFAEAIVSLELRNNKIKNKIEEYNTDGNENWTSFKQKLNQDLEELGIALKGFVTKF